MPIKHVHTSKALRAISRMLHVALLRCSETPSTMTQSRHVGYVLIESVTAKLGYYFLQTKEPWKPRVFVGNRAIIPSEGTLETNRYSLE